jgi:hypothetical protein
MLFAMVANLVVSGGAAQNDGNVYIDTIWPLVAKQQAPLALEKPTTHDRACGNCSETRCRYHCRLLGGRLAKCSSPVILHLCLSKAPHLILNLTKIHLYSKSISSNMVSMNFRAPTAQFCPPAGTGAASMNSEGNTAQAD